VAAVEGAEVVAAAERAAVVAERAAVVAERVAVVAERVAVVAERAAARVALADQEQGLARVVPEPGALVMRGLVPVVPEEAPARPERVRARRAPGQAALPAPAARAMPAQDPGRAPRAAETGAPTPAPAPRGPSPRGKLLSHAHRRSWSDATSPKPSGFPKQS
jgi:hypothetical protein